MLGVSYSTPFFSLKCIIAGQERFGLVKVVLWFGRVGRVGSWC